MKSVVRRIFVEKKKGFDVEAHNFFNDIKENLGVQGLESLRILNRYDISGVEDEEFLLVRNTILSEAPVDRVYDEEVVLEKDEQVFAMEYLPGQYDQRADSAAQCVQILTQGEKPDILSAKVVVLKGRVSNEEIAKIKHYLINPVDSREAGLEKPISLKLQTEEPKQVKVLEGFIDMSEAQLKAMMENEGFAMNLEDLKFCQEYFKHTEKRNPTITEIKVIDTYWSDHCRHTTFLTQIEEVKIEDGPYVEPIKRAYEGYLKAREFVYGSEDRDICLMDLAIIGMKELRKKGVLQDLDVSEEINACSIVVPVDRDGQVEEWLVMFKNETHNHPTEIEPFGGAATCLGGAIRDPLSGRSYVYQAMRVTGSGDPRVSVEKTLPGKLPQRKITTEAAHGYSSYGNQIGLATGQVAEIYHEGYVAKRMEIGAVIAAAPKENVIRANAVEGDVVILVGGRTGRDGCGGATGSSKEHDEESILTCGAEVQKGNPPTERKIQRLFRNPQVSTMIKKCNDFGAGGVSVAIGELTDSLEINLDSIPKKYDGLDGTELAISESQERMAVVIPSDKEELFIALAREENLEATRVAIVTESGRLIMKWRGDAIVDLSREFLNTNGVKQRSKVEVQAPPAKSYLSGICPLVERELPDVKKAWLKNLQDLNIASQKGLVERFDSTIGAGSVLMPFGGKYQSTPTESMVAKIPVLSGETNTGTVMTYGFNPRLSAWSPFHGALYAVIEAVAKIVATGGDYKKVRLTLQEYFEKLGEEPTKWGKPFSALLGALYAQQKLGIPAIGGKDSMSGTFKDLNVPPTLVAFAVGVVNVDKVISPEFKKAGSKVVLIPLEKDSEQMPNFAALEKAYSRIHQLINEGKILAAHTVRNGGLAEAITKMAFGNRIGVELVNIQEQNLFTPDYGSIILEVNEEHNLDESFNEVGHRLLGYTSTDEMIKVNGALIDLDEAYEVWEQPLEKVFPVKTKEPKSQVDINPYDGANRAKSTLSVIKPRVFMPVFPGTNCEYDTAKAFERAGAQVNTLIFKNLTSKEIEESIEAMVKGIADAQIIMLPGGFSGGDEPDGSGKFIATAFRNPRVKEAVNDLLKVRDGLMLGVCNGFQALIKLGLVPYGEIVDMDDNSPTLTFNNIGRHVSQMVETKVVSTLSPWFNNLKVGDIHTIPVSHGEGRFVAPEQTIVELANRGQIATQYVDDQGRATMEMPFNPNGSLYAVEGITSPDGRVLGKMGHSERIGQHVSKNVPGVKDQRLFEAGVGYFK